MDKLIIYGEVKESKPKIYDRHKIDSYVANLPEGSEFELIIKPIQDARSLKLNRTYWMYLTMIGDELGYTKHEMHIYFKMKFLCESVEVNGESILDCKSTADLSTKEFCEYLEKIFRYCAQQIGYVLPDIQDIRQIKNSTKN